MRKSFVVILALALLPASWALAQDGGRKHGRNREDGGSNNPGGGREASAPREEKQAEPAEKPAKHQPREKKQHAVRENSQSPSMGVNNGMANQSPKTRVNNPSFNRVNTNRENRRGNANRENAAPGNNSLNNTRGAKTRTHGADRTNVMTENHSGPRQVPEKFRKMGITQLPSPITDHNRILRADKQHSTLIVPKAGPGGAVIKGNLISGKNISSSVVVKTQMGAITNAKFVSQINIYNNTETVKGNYYWHTAHGYNYCHYYDPWGYHWYGWYVGPHYFWTRWYGNNWWWYDDYYDRWCYWHAGGWWWQDPARVNIVYVYHNNNYTPVDNVDAPANNDGSVQMVFQSNDGTRKVKVLGDGRDGFLFDTSGSYSFEPVFLASGVKDVKFSDTSRGQALQIILTLNDGTFRMFDENGVAYNAR